MTPTNDHWRKALTVLGYRNPVPSERGGWIHMESHRYPDMPIPTDLGSLLERCRENDIIPELLYDSAHIEWLWKLSWGPYKAMRSIDSDGGDTTAIILALAALHDTKENRNG